ncbi:hypothetical protein [Candidatus Nitrosocosmicus arcticus]|nr:hypothetical protein [Candidatus Nitrosocosmicus arcticus]
MNNATREANLGWIKSIKLNIEYDLKESLCLDTLRETSKVISLNMVFLENDSLDYNANGQLTQYKIVENNSLRGSSKTTPTWFEYHSCRKGLGGLLNIDN